MTQDEIIRSPIGREQLVALTREAGFFEFNVEGWINEFERFAALVAAHTTQTLTKAHEDAFQSYVDQAKADRELEALAARLDEREACAKVADGELMNTNMLTSYPPKSSAAWNIAAAIRERSANARARDN